MIELRKMDDGVELIDGVRMNFLNPDTFHIPSNEARAAVKAGSVVKIGLRHPNTPGERFWVIVDGVDDTGVIHGIVDNDLVYYDLPYKAHIAFTSANILAVG